MSDYPKGNYWVTKNVLVLETLPDIYILEFVLVDKKARADFNTIFPYLSEERQEYLTELIEKHPFVKNKMFVDPQTRADQRQARVNTKGIRVPMTPRLRKIKKRKQRNDQE
jgi:hypothetical protein